MTHRAKRLAEPIPLDETYAIKKDRRRRTREQRESKRKRQIKHDAVRQEQRQVVQKQKRASKDRQANAGIKRMMGYGNDDTQHGTFLTGLAKMQAEEAKLARCSDCGSSGGRHLRVCPSRT